MTSFQYRCVTSRSCMFFVMMLHFRWWPIAFSDRFKPKVMTTLVVEKYKSIYDIESERDSDDRGHLASSPFLKYLVSNRGCIYRRKFIQIVSDISHKKTTSPTGPCDKLSRLPFDFPGRGFDWVLRVNHYWKIVYWHTNWNLLQ